ncbi:hypothetical protein GIB67_034778 [Kingdonia uniflora]|uniref:DUF4283 domain-containing protein n=1 Tax=Kingdonia uniflora TaxID=39325 RepID=A0A7J7MDT2_9MAGN|nr:hypothetical protein GIB67_034778 [Kingdonia uniflora]
MRAKIKSSKFADEIKAYESFPVGYFVGKRMDFNFVKESLTRIWSTKADFDMKLQNNNLFLFQFANEKDRENALELGSQYVANRLFVIRPWSLYIEKERSPTLAPYLYGHARACVEINYQGELPTIVPFDVDNGEAAYIDDEYTWLPPRCDDCCLFGHHTNRGEVSALTEGKEERENSGNCNLDKVGEKIDNQDRSGAGAGARNKNQLANTREGCWNTRGLNDVLKQREVWRLVKYCKLGIIGVVETKVLIENRDVVQKKLCPGWQFLDNHEFANYGRIWIGYDPLLKATYKNIELVDNLKSRQFLDRWNLHGLLVLKQPIKCQWTPGRAPFVTLNTDGSVVGNKRDWGVMLRENISEPIVAASGSFPSSSITVQKAVEMGLVLAAKHNRKMMTDSTIVLFYMTGRPVLLGKLSIWFSKLGR